MALPSCHQQTKHELLWRSRRICNPSVSRLCSLSTTNRPGKEHSKRDFQVYTGSSQSFILSFHFSFLTLLTRPTPPTPRLPTVLLSSQSCSDSQRPGWLWSSHWSFGGLSKLVAQGMKTELRKVEQDIRSDSPEALVPTTKGGVALNPPDRWGTRAHFCTLTLQSPCSGTWEVAGCHVHILGPSLALVLEEPCVGRAESCTVRGKKAFRFHSGVKISLLNKYHFSKATALLLGTLMTSFEVD